MTHIQIKEQHGSRMLTTTDGRSLDISGIDPSDLLAAALAICSGSSVRKMASRKHHELSDLTVGVELERDRESKTAHFRIHLDMDGDLGGSTPRQLQKAAKKSYISRLLSNPIDIQVDVHEQEKISTLRLPSQGSWQGSQALTDG